MRRTEMIIIPGEDPEDPEITTREEDVPEPVNWHVEHDRYDKLNELEEENARLHEEPRREVESCGGPVRDS
jgi:hypothetical protein